MNLRLLLSLTASLVLTSASLAQTLQPNFSSTLVATVPAPTAIAFLPDQRMLITSQTNGVYLRALNGTLTQALSFTSGTSGSNPQFCTTSEGGVLGIAVDPLFAQNRHVYIFYTARNGASSCNNVNYNASGSYSAVGQRANRVSRFTFNADLATINPAETVLVDDMPARGGNHNAGDLHFGKDGFLYIAIGDGGTNWTGSGSAGGNDAARDRHVLTGKILRITRDGGIPPGNPFTGANTAECRLTGTSGTVGNHCRETFAWGLRNPFRFAMDPNATGTRFYINDVGQGEREEVSESESGADYGWNCREGSRTNSSSGKCSAANAPLSTLRDPVYEYPHGTTVPGTSVSGCNSITGGAFVPNGVWPSAYDNTYLVADYVCGAIFRIAANGVPNYANAPAPTVPITTAADFATALGGSSATSLRFGSYGNGVGLYYTTYAEGGQVRVITYQQSGNSAPNVSALTASPQNGAAPFFTTLTATATDPNAGDTLTYFWDFGDGTPEAITSTNSTTKTYNTNGVYVVSVRTRDNNFAFSAPRTLTIQVGNTAPVATITTPTASETFTVGQTVTLSGSATDAQDGALAASALSWRVILHHDAHTHPFFGPQTGNNLQIVTPPPEDLAAAANSYLEIVLTATDSGGLQHVTSQNFQPRKRDLTLQSSPSGRRVDVNGTILTTPATRTVWAGWQIPITVRDQNAGSNGYRFSSWSDGGARSHAYDTPDANSTLTANFTTGGFVPSIDVDNNSAFDAGTDGVLLLRYMLGFRDAALIAGNVIGANAERNSAAAIQNYLLSVVASFDVDGRSGVNAATDGVIAIRYLLGLVDAPLTAGTGSLNPAATVKSTLDGLTP